MRSELRTELLRPAEQDQVARAELLRRAEQNKVAPAKPEPDWEACYWPRASLRNTAPRWRAGRKAGRRAVSVIRKTSISGGLLCHLAR